MRDQNRASRLIVLGIGEFHASGGDVVLRTVLGSCVAVCLHDPERRLGGMNHFALPGAGGGTEMSGRYGEDAMILLLNMLVRLGAQPAAMQARIFGASHVLVSRSPESDVASANAAFAEEWLAAHGIRVAARLTNGCHPLEVVFQTGTGRAFAREVSFAREVPSDQGAAHA